MVIAFNFVIFFCILVVLSKHTKKKYKRAVNPRRLVLRFVVNIFGIVSLYGFTWLSAFFVATQEETANFAFQVIFTVLNSLQGFFLFIFFCVISKDSRDAWKEIVCRGRPRSKSTNKQSSSSDHTTRSGQTAGSHARRRYDNTMSDSNSTMERRYTGADSSMMGTLPSTLGTSSIVSDRRDIRLSMSSMPPEIAEEPELNNEDTIANENTEMETELYITNFVGPTTSPIAPMDAEEGGASVIENVEALNTEMETELYITNFVGPTTSPIAPMDAEEGGASVIENVEALNTEMETELNFVGPTTSPIAPMDAEEGGASVIENVEALINDQDGAFRGRESGEHMQSDGELISNPFAQI